MIVVMRRDAKEQDIETMIEQVQSLGLKPHVLRGTERTVIAAIGDEVNDLAMIEGAGLGIAMGNAVASVKKAARVQTLSHAEDGVAHAIDRILSAEW